jgi:hypothetical protein
MGAVYEAVQEDLGRRVALKILTTATSHDALTRFRQEAEAAARLGHPHIVQVSDFQIRVGEPPFLVMELLEGRSLADVIADGPLPWRRAGRIGLQVLAALVAAHEAKIVHRDIKPDNVFLVRSLAVPDMVKVLDFGVAKLLEPSEDGPLTTQGLAIGTPAYMAPEQARTEAVDERTDLYAVGVCLYEAVTGGRLPIEAENLVALRMAIGAAPSVPLRQRAPDVDPRFEVVVERALAKAPKDRFASAREMADALGACLEEQPPETLDAPPLDDTARAEPPVTARLGADVTCPVEATARVPAPAVTPAIVRAAPPRVLRPRAVRTPAPRRQPPRPPSTAPFHLSSRVLVVCALLGGASIGLGFIGFVVQRLAGSHGNTHAARATTPPTPPTPPTATFDVAVRADPRWFGALESKVRTAGFHVSTRTYKEPDTAAEPVVLTLEVSRSGKEALIVLYDYPDSEVGTAGAAAYAARQTGFAADQNGAHVVMVRVTNDRAAAQAILDAIRP